MTLIKVLNTKVNNNGIEKIVHPVIILDENEMILVDAGFTNQIEQFIEEGKRLNIELNKLTKIVITHHDYDHMGSLASLKKHYPNVEIISSKIQAEYISGNKKNLRLDSIKNKLNELPIKERESGLKMIESIKAVPKCKVDRLISQGESISKSGDTICIETPGHMPGHISIYVKSEKTLITGDAMNVIDGELSGANPEFTFDMEEAIKSIKNLSNYDIENIICYHGGKYPQNGKLALDKLIKEIL